MPSIQQMPIGKAKNDMTIFYSVRPCPLGKLLVAMTERGICKVSLGDSAEALTADMEAELAQAECIRDDERLDYCINQIIAYLEGRQPQLDLPLDVRATAFQIKVWGQLQQIPMGETRSYSQIAAAISQPAASRAVARACASNPAALVIPCHRIIRKDKSLGGYRWGIERKQALLAREQNGKSAASD